MSEPHIPTVEIRKVMDEMVRGRDVSLKLAEEERDRGLSEFIRGGASGLDTAGRW